LGSKKGDFEQRQHKRPDETQAIERRDMNGVLKWCCAIQISQSVIVASTFASIASRTAHTLSSSQLLSYSCIEYSQQYAACVPPAVFSILNIIRVSTIVLKLVESGR
jgi:hypothetical protein